MARFTALATALTILLLSAAATGLPAGRDDGG